MDAASYRTREPLRVIGEVFGWQSHTDEEIQIMPDTPEKLKQQGIEAINE